MWEWITSLWDNKEGLYSATVQCAPAARPALGSLTPHGRKAATSRRTPNAPQRGRETIWSAATCRRFSPIRGRRPIGGYVGKLNAKGSSITARFFPERLAIYSARSASWISEGT